jgi:hypothetical protein
MTTPTWSLTGNSGTDAATHFLGTTDLQPIVFRVMGREVMRLEIDGRLGIGTDNPAGQLEVVSRGEFRGVRFVDGGGTTDIIFGEIVIHGSNGGQLRLLGSFPTTRVRSENGDLILEAFPRSEAPFANVLLSPEGGNVGIGVQKFEFNEVPPEGFVGPQRPETALHVVGDRIRLQNRHKVVDLRADGGAVDLHSETDDLFIRSNGPHGHNRVLINPFPGMFGDGNVGIGTTEPRARLHVAGDLIVTGTKAFVHPQPDDPTKEIVYVALEGGEAGTYLRGSGRLTHGRAVVRLPEHFGLVSGDEGLTVQLTGRGEWLQLYVERLSASELVVREAAEKSGSFDYLIQGVRRGYEGHAVIRDRRADRDAAAEAPGSPSDTLTVAASWVRAASLTASPTR